MEQRPSPCTHLDHLAVVAPTLDAGSRFVREALGVEVQEGGSHPRMGTHNRLLRLGDFVYLEVIAPDPAASGVERRRWFDLDAITPWTPPRLAAWIARTGDIRAARAAFVEDLGTVEPMSRGALSWLITIPPDGTLPLGGAAPALIEWQTAPHPASRLPDAGCALVGLEIHHPDPARVEAVLASLGFSGPVTVDGLPAGAAPRLVAHVQTAQGMRRLAAP